MRMVRVREKVFRNRSGFRFNVCFVDCTSVFVKSVLETSLSFTLFKAQKTQKGKMTSYSQGKLIMQHVQSWVKITQGFCQI